MATGIAIYHRATFNQCPCTWRSDSYDMMCIYSPTCREGKGVACIMFISTLNRSCSTSMTVGSCKGCASNTLWPWKVQHFCTLQIRCHHIIPSLHFKIPSSLVQALMLYISVICVHMWGLCLLQQRPVSLASAVSATEMNSFLLSAH